MESTSSAIADIYIGLWLITQWMLSYYKKFIVLMKSNLKTDLEYFLAAATNHAM